MSCIVVKVLLSTYLLSYLVYIYLVKVKDEILTYIHVLTLCDYFLSFEGLSGKLHILEKVNFTFVSQKKEIDRSRFNITV